MTLLYSQVSNLTEYKQICTLASDCYRVANHLTQVTINTGSTD